MDPAVTGSGPERRESEKSGESLPPSTGRDGGDNSGLSTDFPVMAFDKWKGLRQRLLGHLLGSGALAAPFLATALSGWFGGSKVLDLASDARDHLNRPVSAASIDPAAAPGSLPPVLYSPVIEPVIKDKIGWGAADVISPSRFACDLGVRPAGEIEMQLVRLSYSVPDKVAFIEAMNQAYAAGKIDVGQGESAQQALARSMQSAVLSLRETPSVSAAELRAQLSRTLDTLGLSSVVQLPEAQSISVQPAKENTISRLWDYTKSAADWSWGAAALLVAAAYLSARWAFRTARSTFFTVEAPNITPVYRLGQLVATEGPGLHFKWPHPVSKLGPSRSMAVDELAQPIGHAQLSDGTDYQYRSVIQLQIIPGKEREALLGLVQARGQIQRWTDAYMERRLRGLSLDDLDKESTVKQLAEDAQTKLSEILVEFGYRIVALNLQDLRPEREVLDARQRKRAAEYERQRLQIEADGYGLARRTLIERYGEAIELAKSKGVPEAFIQDFMLRDREADAVEAAADKGQLVVTGFGSRGGINLGMSQDEMVAAVVAAFRASQNQPGGGGRGGSKKS